MIQLVESCPSYRSNPARAARKFALSGATNFSRVIDQMRDALQMLAFEQRRHSRLQIERALLQRPIREGGCMKVSLRPGPRAQRPQHCKQFFSRAGRRIPRRNAGNQSETPFMGTFGRVREPLTYAGKCKRRDATLPVTFNRRRTP